MSLLNQVLQDLDQRAVPPAQRPLHVAEQTTTEPAAEVPADRSAFDPWRWSGWALVVMAGIAAGWVHLQPPIKPVVVEPLPLRPYSRAVPPVDPAPATVVKVRADNDAGLSPGEAGPIATVRAPIASEPLTTISADVPLAAAADTSMEQPTPVDLPKDHREVAAAAVFEEPRKAYLPLKNDRPPDGFGAPGMSAKVKVQSGEGLTFHDRVRRQIEAGELSAAEQAVMQRLAVRAGDREARELLVGLMLRGGRYSEALDAINAGLLHHPGHREFLLIKARLLAQSGDATGAVTVLEGRLTNGGGAPEALQMLGALHQQQGHYAEAVAVYRRLIEEAPRTGPAWVGLAIGLDALGDPDALEAYTRALSLGGLPEAAARYARQRLAALGPGNG
jgi:MSHA biogenesis protein MshN